MKKVNFSDPIIKIGVVAFVTIAALMVFYNILGTAGEVLVRLSTFLRTLRDAALAIIIGIIIAFLLLPYVRFIKNKITSKIFRKSEKASYISAILVTYAVALGFVAVVISSILPVLIDNIRDFSANGSTYVKTVGNWIEGVFSLPLFTSDRIISAYESVIAGIQENITVYLASFLDNTFHIITGVTGAVVNTVLGFVVGFYVMMENESLSKSAKRTIFAAMGESKAKLVVEEAKFAGDTFRKFFNGRLLESFITALIVLLCFVFAGVKYSALMAVVVFITNLIPYFGPIIGGAITVVLTLIDDPQMIWYAVIVLAIVNAVNEWVILPKVVGDVVGMSPFWVMLGVLIGGGLFGFVGMLIGIPCAAVLHDWAHRYINHKIDERLKNKNAAKENDAREDG
ncbi:MAG: AI-2E family transporter [Clostridiales bacterium]|nr:AI-2E family transporter [Clostridiales bacterium]